MKICSNCGGSFNEKEPKCPYCGQINEVGAEIEYNKKLNNIRKNLDNVDELAVADYKKDLFAFLKTFLITLVIVGSITLLLSGLVIKKEQTYSGSDRKEMDEKIEAIKAIRSYTDKWDELYDEGRYEEMCDAAREATENRGFSFYDWPHYNFYKAYESFYTANEDRESVLSKDNPSNYEISTALHSVLYAYYSAVSGQKNARFSSEEEAIFKKEWEELVKNTCEAFNMTEKELDILRIRANSDSYPSYSEVSSFVEERWGK